MGGYIGSQTSVALYDSYTKKESDTLDLISYRIITKRAMAEAGLTLVDGSFESGAVVHNTSEVVLQELTGKTFGWGGIIPVGGYIVPAGSTPATSGGIGAGAWVDRTDVTLRSEINVVWKNFACVADVDGNVKQGDKIAVENYHESGSSGPLFFTVVSENAGIDDGGQYIDLPISSLQLKQNLKQPYSPEAWGAKADAITDDTSAVFNCSLMGKLVKFSSRDYLVSAFPSTTSVFWSGDGFDCTKIITTGEEVFPVANYGRVSGIKFEALNTDTTKLFGSDEATKLSAYIEKCYFKDYDYVAYYPTNSDSTRFHECYFRGGNYGIFGNYAHNHHITQCVFWQQKEYSIHLQRGSASSIRDCNFVSTFGATSKVYLYSQDCIFEGNYIEHYTEAGGASLPTGFLTIGSINSTNFPTVRNNLFNVNSGFNYCVYINSLNSTQAEYPIDIYENEFMSHVVSPIGFSNLNLLSNIDIRNNKTSSGVANYPRLRKYSSYVKDINTSSGTNITVGIDSGTVYDPFSLSTGSNTIKSYCSGKQFKVTVTGKYTATVSNTGINIKVRDTNNSTLGQLLTTSVAVGDIPIAASFIIDSSEFNTSYRVDWATISGFSAPSVMTLLVELEELSY